MRTEQLEYLIEISKNSSMSAASEKLFITPAALTLSVKKLEEELGTELLVRSNRGVELTKDGMHIVEAAKAFFKEVAVVKNKSESLKSQLSGVLDIYTGQSAVDQFLPQLICEFHDLNPHVYINPIVLDIKKSMELMIKEKDKELLFCYDLWNMHKKYSFDEQIFNFSPLSIGKQYCIVSRKMELSKYKIVSQKKLRQYPLLVYRADSYSSDELQITQTDYAGSSEKIVILNNQAVYNEMLHNGLGYSMCVRLPMKKEFALSEDLMYIPIEELQERFCKFGYVTCRNHPLSEIAESFVAYVKEFFLLNCM